MMPMDYFNHKRNMVILTVFCFVFFFLFLIQEVALWMDNIVTKICSQEKAIRAPSEELDADTWEGGRVRNWKVRARY